MQKKKIQRDMRRRALVLAMCKQTDLSAVTVYRLLEQRRKPVNALVRKAWDEVIRRQSAA